MSYEQLKVWQKAMSMAEMLYVHTKQFPKEEIYGLVSQMRRAAVSVPSNISEGRHRNSKADYSRFLYIAYASTKELLTQIELSQRLKYLSKKDFETVNKVVHEVSKMLYALIQSLK